MHRAFANLAEVPLVTILLSLKSFGPSHSKPASSKQGHEAHNGHFGYLEALLMKGLCTSKG